MSRDSQACPWILATLMAFAEIKDSSQSMYVSACAILMQNTLILVLCLDVNSCFLVLTADISSTTTSTVTSFWSNIYTHLHSFFSFSLRWSIQFN